MRTKDKREILEKLLREEREALDRRRPPLMTEPATKTWCRRVSPRSVAIPSAKTNLLQSLARAAASRGETDRLFRELTQKIPPRYDGYDWWADAMPRRQIIRDSVLTELRRQGHTGVPPKVVDKITSKVVDRAVAKGRKPEDHKSDGWAYCDCKHCTKVFEARSKALFGEVLTKR